MLFFACNEAARFACISFKSSTTSLDWNVADAYVAKEMIMWQKRTTLASVSPINHSRDAFPRPEARHTLQLFVCDPSRNYEFLRVATTEPMGKGIYLQATIKVLDKPTT